MNKLKIVTFCGSLRKAAYNRMLLAEATKLLEEHAEVEELPFADFPLFNQDLENPTPAQVLLVKEKIQAADGVLVVTPENNRSLPGGLKNMLDWTSRSPRPWGGKPVYVMGASDGNLGTVTAQYDLRRILLYFGCRVMGTPEFFLGHVDEKFDAQGVLRDEKTKEKIAEVAQKFLEFVRTHKANS